MQPSIITATLKTVKALVKALPIFVLSDQTFDWSNLGSNNMLRPKSYVQIPLLKGISSN